MFHFVFVILAARLTDNLSLAEWMGGGLRLSCHFSAHMGQTGPVVSSVRQVGPQLSDHYLGIAHVLLSFLTIHCNSQMA